MSVLFISGLLALTALRLLKLYFRKADIGLLGARGCFFALLFGIEFGVGMKAVFANSDKGNGVMSKLSKCVGQVWSSPPYL